MILIKAINFICFAAKINDMDALLQPWPWYVSGLLIVAVMAILLFLGRNFGMSANLRTICSACGAGSTCDFFCFDWKSQRWNLLVMAGSVLGGFLAAHYLSADTTPDINIDVINRLKSLGFNSAGEAYLPTELFGNDVFTSPKGIILLLIGGILVGFGSRYAGGCTSGHAISGLTDLQLPSLIAVVGFFVGGLIMVHLLFPLLF